MPLTFAQTTVDAICWRFRLMLASAEYQHLFCERHANSLVAVIPAELIGKLNLSTKTHGRLKAWAALCADHPSPASGKAFLIFVDFLQNHEDKFAEETIATEYLVTLFRNITAYYQYASALKSDDADLSDILQTYRTIVEMLQRYLTPDFVAWLTTECLFFALAESLDAMCQLPHE